MPRAVVEKRCGSDSPDGMCFQLELVRCGKSDCSSCPHGPYWYVYWKQGARTRSAYIGRELDEDKAERLVSAKMASRRQS